uniref:Squamosa promoter-binding-like protein 6 n=2 Tax=Anthurium amnicola TaxID=1678845 RepID=A0A1D1YRL6_9ARAE
MEWDLNDWRWDGDLLVATPMDAAPSDCGNKQLFPVPSPGGLFDHSSPCSAESGPIVSGKGKGESEKRRREMMVADEDVPGDEAGFLTLKLGGRVYPVTDHVDLVNWDGKNGKKSKVQVGNSIRATCQVEGCGADLSDAKDYHRRHKVCEMHAKASEALVGNVLQRFCQQCSRFHLLQEFDEGKRSCRRRLAGHNRRRRKTNPDSVASGSSLMDDRSSNYLLISLLRILANLHSDSSEQLKDQSLLSHLLKNLASLSGSFDANSLPGLLQTPQGQQKLGTAAGTSSQAAHAMASNGVAAQESSWPVCSRAKMNCVTEIQRSTARPTDQPLSIAVSSEEMPWKRNTLETSPGERVVAIHHGQSTGRVPMKGDIPVETERFSLLNQVLPTGSDLEKVGFRSFDLNDVCSGHDITEGPDNFITPANQPSGSLCCPSWVLKSSQKTSLTQTSGNSDSASAQSHSTSNGDAKNCTDRMVFKLFGKDPSDFPLVLRSQILDWLSNSPMDIEGYIRPGCIILTVYLHLTDSTWKELCHNLRCSLERLLDIAGDDFWGTGWLYARIQDQIAFIYNGCVVLDTPLLFNSHNHCQILSVSPLAVSASKRVNFTVKGLNLAQSSIRLLCSFDGKYLVQEMTQALVSSTGTTNEHDNAQCLQFSCLVPNATGRGFIEVEDQGLSNSFFPFIVAEEDVSYEICTLESIINSIYSNSNYDDGTGGMKTRTLALDFVHEMGWLLRRSHLRSCSENLNSHANIYPLSQFRWLVEFSMDHNWCAVVKKLLDILFSGAVDVGGHSFELAISESAFLHSAVQKNQRPVVELLLRYVPADDLGCSISQNTQVEHFQRSLLFRPDMLGPFNVTPLHIAASMCDGENVLDALTDDPGQLGIKAWMSVRDSSGLTPEDYAHSRGFKSYIHLVQKKINQKSAAKHTVLDIPGMPADLDINQKQTSGSISNTATGFQIDKRRMTLKLQPSCRLCTPCQPSYRIENRNLTYRPAMLFMVGIAAVCVCVGIFLRSPPEVRSVFPPFRWELLKCGYM